MIIGPTYLFSCSGIKNIKLLVFLGCLKVILLVSLYIWDGIGDPSSVSLILFVFSLLKIKLDIYILIYSVIPSESCWYINSIISCSRSNSFDDISMAIWMEALNTIKNIVSVGWGPIFEFVEPLNSQLEILRILETTFDLRLHIISVKSMAVVVIVYHFLVSDVS